MREHQTFSLVNRFKSMIETDWGTPGGVRETPSPIRETPIYSARNEKTMICKMRSKASESLSKVPLDSE